MLFLLFVGAGFCDMEAVSGTVVTSTSRRYAPRDESQLQLCP
jgi:hypothetical protein